MHETFLLKKYVFISSREQLIGTCELLVSCGVLCVDYGAKFFMSDYSMRRIFTQVIEDK